MLQIISTAMMFHGMEWSNDLASNSGNRIDMVPLNLNSTKTEQDVRWRRRLGRGGESVVAARKWRRIDD